MAEQIYFKHTVITSGIQDDVETEINNYAKTNEFISVNVTPERIGFEEVEGYKIPKYIYHICMVFKSKRG